LKLIGNKNEPNISHEFRKVSEPIESKSVVYVFNRVLREHRVSSSQS